MNPIRANQNSPNWTHHSPPRALRHRGAASSAGVRVAFSALAGFSSAFLAAAAAGSGAPPRDGGSGGNTGAAGAAAAAGSSVQPAAGATGPEAAAGAAVLCDGGPRPGVDPDDGAASMSVGAAALCASSGDGTGTAAWQYGHLTRLPADSSRARNRFPHDGQPSVMGMTNSP